MLFLKNQDLSYRRGPITSPVINPKEDILSAVNQLSSAELKNWVTWITSFPSRYHKLEKPNVHVEALAEKLKTIMSASNHPYQIDMIDHKSTKQKSLRLRITGSTSPDDLVILGAHFDSIVSYGNDFAPGADDDASGSANLLEVLRVLLKQERPQRSVEFLWYAGEESGLLGSAEIAESYKKTGKKVISVLQLDMTLFPGAGKNRLALITDYTSAWLNDILLKLSQAYLTVEVLESQCGYACSDHASWHKNGFSAAMPFESTFDTYNKEIHTRNDVISPRLDFEHSLQFSKLAMAYVMELANSQATNPIY